MVCFISVLCFMVCFMLRFIFMVCFMVCFISVLFSGLFYLRCAFLYALFIYVSRKGLISGASAPTLVGDGETHVLEAV